MTEQRSTQAKAGWADPERVDRWVARDADRRAVETARDLAAAIVALDMRPALVMELAAGAGSFLATFLRTFPDARGLWSDSSLPMARHARNTLSEFHGRVDYLLTDLRWPGISAEAAPGVLICARVTHGLDIAELAEFYRRAFALIVPGGWLVNLDHMAVPAAWNGRYDELTARFYEGSERRAAGSGGAGKDRGSHTLRAHLDALAGAGFTEMDTPWRLLSTVLLMARRPSGPQQAGIDPVRPA